MLFVAVLVILALFVDVRIAVALVVLSVIGFFLTARGK